MPPCLYLVIGEQIALPRYDSGHFTSREFFILGKGECLKEDKYALLLEQ
jgi:hypothetical protein